MRIRRGHVRIEGDAHNSLLRFLAEKLHYYVPKGKTLLLRVDLIGLEQAGVRLDQASIDAVGVDSGKLTLGINFRSQKVVIEVAIVGTTASIDISDLASIFEPEMGAIEPSEELSEVLANELAGPIAPAAVLSRIENIAVGNRFVYASTEEIRGIVGQLLPNTASLSKQERRREIDRVIDRLKRDGYLHQAIEIGKGQIGYGFDIIGLRYLKQSTMEDARRQLDAQAAEISRLEGLIARKAELLQFRADLLQDLENGYSSREVRELLAENRKLLDRVRGAEEKYAVIRNIYLITNR
jgi:hypothetical protein